LLAARLMYERGEASGALAVLDQYAGAARQNPDYQILRALLLQRAGRNAEAADCYQTALAIRPQESRWWYGLGRALDADHREAAARQAYEKARETGNLPADLQQAVERRLR
jgi:MSHA biogenesis protein MshN